VILSLRLGLRLGVDGSVQRGGVLQSLVNTRPRACQVRSSTIEHTQVDGARTARPVHCHCVQRCTRVVDHPLQRSQLAALFPEQSADHRQRETHSCNQHPSYSQANATRSCNGSCIGCGGFDTAGSCIDRDINSTPGVSVERSTQRRK